MTDHPTEAGRWYATEKTPGHKPADFVNEVPMTTRKGMRATRRTDATKLHLVPSVTSIIKMLAAPGLIRYFENQLLDAAWSHKAFGGFHEDKKEEWQEAVRTASKEHARLAREKGTATHAVLQSFFETGNVQDGYERLCENAQSTLDHNCGIRGWVTEKPFVHDAIGYGGKVDLHSTEWVIDFKGTDAESHPDKDMAKLKTYTEHHMQLAAYRVGLKLRESRAAILYFDRESQDCRFVEVDEADLTKGFASFLACLTLWRNR